MRNRRGGSDPTSVYRAGTATRPVPRSAFRVSHWRGAVMGGVWLAIDTATEIASVAAGRPPRADSGAQVQSARRHAAEIVRLVDFVLGRLGITPRDLRSEEHTSELQSHSDLVCRLLLEN